jgi:tetratricopeptide (TPR) repeat protein
MMYGAGGRHADADRTFADLMRLFAEQGRDRTQGAAMCVNNWANSAVSAGQMLRAAELSERSANLAREVDPDRGPLPGTLATFANALSLVGRSPRALAVADEAVSMARAPEHHRLLFYALYKAAGVALDAGRLDLAERHLAELEAVVREDPARAARRTPAFEDMQARVALAHGDAASAVKLARSSLAKAEALGFDAGSIVSLLLPLASSLNEHGDHDEARQVADRARAMAEAALGGYRHSHNLGAAHLELGRAQAGLGDMAAARETLRAAHVHLLASDGEAGPYTRRAAESLARLPS